MRHPQIQLYFGVGALALLLAFGVHYLCDRDAHRPGPRTLDEAAEVAAGLGLYFRSDAGDGIESNRIIVSDTPVTFERAGGVRVGDPRHPCLVGTVAVYKHWRAMMHNYDPACSVVWGELFVYGDPMFIARLTRGDQ